MARIEKELEAESQGHVDSLWKITSVGGGGRGKQPEPQGGWDTKEIGQSIR